MPAPCSGTGSLTKTGRRRLQHHRRQHRTRRHDPVDAGTLVVNGSLASNVTVNSGGMMGGNGTIIGRWPSTVAPWRPATRSAR